MKTKLMLGGLLVVMPMLRAVELPVVIAHRGASGYIVEHTREAKVMAHAMGADYLEQDVVLSKDGVPVVLHDVGLGNVSDVADVFPERVTEDGKYLVGDFTLAELRRLQLVERMENRFPKGKFDFRISTLEEELALIQGVNKSTGREAGVYVEVKKAAWHRERGQDLSKATLEVLKRFGYDKPGAKCWVQIFELDEVKRWRGELEWKGNLLLLMSARKVLPTVEEFKDIAKVANGVGPDLRMVATAKEGATDFVKRAHKAGLVVHGYTVRTDALPKWVGSTDEYLKVLFKDAGIDGVFTDFPDTVVQWLRTETKKK